MLNMKFLSYTTICLLTLFWLPDSLETGPANASEEQSVLIDTLMENYDRRIRPNSKGSPVHVSVDMFITSFDSIKETTMDYVVTMYFRQHWVDPRLSFNGTESLVVTDNVRDRFWVPDLFFVNVKSAHFHYVTKDNVFFRIEPAGEILYSVRLSLTLSCHMSLEDFPMDKQACGIQIEPYGYTTRDLQLRWYDKNAVAWDEQLKMAQYELIGSTTDEKIQDYSTGFFGHVNVMFFLIRQLGYYILQTYIPSVLLVVLSWVSFWIDVTAAPARVALGITTVLTLTTQGSGARSELPKVAYAKAIDIWMAACLVFVFAALVEFALVNYLNALGNDRQNLSKFFREKSKENDSISKDSCSRHTDSSGSNWITKTSSISDLGTSYDNIERSPGRVSKSRFTRRPRASTSYKFASAIAYHNAPEGELADALFAEGLKLKNRAITIDRLARIGFPVTFAVFNCIYWPLYMIDR
ncbi:glycine receptor subunit alpha-4-like isoform X2 [Glandiceps talaboti]